MERVKDLINPTLDNMEIRETRERGVTILGAT